MVDNIQGAIWIAELSAQSIVTVELIEAFYSRGFLEYWPNDATGGKMSYYSSWGLTYEMYIKLSISALGDGILSTLPTALGSWGVYSGTSMATPYIAGVVALIKQVQGKNISPQLEIISRLSSTATPINWNDDGNTYSYLALVMQQGEV
jgi:subtilisin family serine protease